MEIVNRTFIKLVRMAFNAKLTEEVDKFLTPELLDAVCESDLYYLAGNAKLGSGKYDSAIPLSESQ